MKLYSNFFISNLYTLDIKLLADPNNCYEKDKIFCVIKLRKKVIKVKNLRKKISDFLI